MWDVLLGVGTILSIINHFLFNLSTSCSWPQYLTFRMMGLWIYQESLLLYTATPWRQIVTFSTKLVNVSQTYDLLPSSHKIKISGLIPGHLSPFHLLFYICWSQLTWEHQTISPRWWEREGWAREREGRQQLDISCEQREISSRLLAKYHVSHLVTQVWPRIIVFNNI